jgi:FkbH-like protein
VRLVVVSNVTMELLGPTLGEHEVRFPGAAAWPSFLADAGPVDADAVIVHVDVDSLRMGAEGRGRADYIIELVEQWVQRNPGIPVLLNTALCRPATPFSFADPIRDDGAVAIAVRWSEAMRRIAARAPLGVVVDLAHLLVEHSLADLITSRYWYAGRVRYSREGFAAIGALYRSVLDSLTTAPRKVLVVDLDNTLWGGVVGEDGVQGIALGEDGAGRCFRDFQFALRGLADAGVLLAVLSKNDPGVLDEVRSGNAMQVLGPDDFVDIDAGWDPKPGRIAAMASRLGLGLDAFVFVDDSPFERGAMEQAMPGVAVPAFPDRPEALVDWLLDDIVPTYFARAVLSDEDRSKTAQYHARRARQVAAGDISAFIDGLGIDLTFVVDDMQHLARLTQLTQKTNQFNLTTERLDPRAMAELIEAGTAHVIGVAYEDRFGKEGIVGLAILDTQRGEMRNLLLSCRVLGRGVEDAVLREVEDRARVAGVKRLAARYIRSEKNGVAADFLAERGYVGADDGNAWTGHKDLG